jgi:Holliday junction resolvase RusA-like endonuclease
MVHNYTPAKSPVADFKARVTWAARQAYRGELIEGPVGVDVHLRFPLPASARKAIKEQVKCGAVVPHTSRPDAENVLKAIFDSLTGVVWRDDSQVSLGSWVKCYHTVPSVEVTIWPL